MVGHGCDEIFVGSLEIPISLADLHFVYLREQAVADVPSGTDAAISSRVCENISTTSMVIVFLELSTELRFTRA